ncbi:hypothetical protein [Saccharopolyspora hattusasensis]|uniref:hypothetical protein n=1 Tax=Saccharopolyspora hattusasensis TaxID=1128679 RepID=UPI003D99533F
MEAARDPARISPQCSEQQFAAMLQRMVANEAPRLFAVVQEYGDRVDRRVAAWGMAFADHAEVVAVDGGLRMNLRKPTNALHAFHIGSHVRARLVWFTPDAATEVSLGRVRLTRGCTDRKRLPGLPGWAVGTVPPMPAPPPHSWLATRRTDLERRQRWHPPC